MLTQHKSVNYLHSKYNVQDERGPKSLDGLNYCMSQSNLQQELFGSLKTLLLVSNVINTSLLLFSASCQLNFS